MDANRRMSRQGARGRAEHYTVAKVESSKQQKARYSFCTGLSTVSVRMVPLSPVNSGLNHCSAYRICTDGATPLGTETGLLYIYTTKGCIVFGHIIDDSSLCHSLSCHDNVRQPLVSAGKVIITQVKLSGRLPKWGLGARPAMLIWLDSDKQCLTA